MTEAEVALKTVTARVAGGSSSRGARPVTAAPAAASPPDVHGADNPVHNALKKEFLKRPFRCLPMVAGLLIRIP